METEPREPEMTYLESLLEEKADEIGRTTGEQSEDAIREYGKLEFRLALLNAHEGRFPRQVEIANSALQKKLIEFYRTPGIPPGISQLVGEIITTAKTLGNLQGQQSFLQSYIDATPEIVEPDY